MRPSGCHRCEGKMVGVVFMTPTPGDYEPGPNGEVAPLPLSCPSCGRRLPKVYRMSDRASWDGINRGGL